MRSGACRGKAKRIAKCSYPSVKPAETPGVAGEFYRPIQMTGLGDNEFVTAIFGVDGFQSIELALRFIGQRLADINAKNGGRLRWLDGQLPKEWEQQEQ